MNNLQTIDTDFGAKIVALNTGAVVSLYAKIAGYREEANSTNPCVHARELSNLLELARKLGQTLTLEVDFGDVTLWYWLNNNGSYEGMDEKDAIQRRLGRVANDSLRIIKGAPYFALSSELALSEDERSWLTIPGEIMRLRRETEQ